MCAAASNHNKYINLELAEPSVEVDRCGNGELLLRSPLPLERYERQIGNFLRRWAKDDPKRRFLAEREGDSWRFVTYGEAAASANSVSQWLIDNGHNSDRPVASLCENSLKLGMFKLGAMQVGIPYMPIAPTYLQNVSKLAYVLAEAKPSVLYVTPSPTMSEVLKQLTLDDVQIISEYNSDSIPGFISFEDLLKTKAMAEVEKRFDAVTPETHAKVLLTSGSTGMPKGVINTNRMMCSNGQGVDQLWKFLDRTMPVLVDWLPWSHTFGTNFNFNLILRHGGLLYIDAGKPIGDSFKVTIENLRDVQPTALHNVPRAFDLLFSVLESDEKFASHVFEKLCVIYYAGAALPSHLWHRIDALSVKCRGERVPIFSAMGSTETGPVATICHWPELDSASVGLPVPGCEIKLVPDGGKLEMRARGPNVTPGYYRRPDLTEKAFDNEGFFKLGDAVAFIDPVRPEKGLRFDGRVAENFKLLSGTWVQVGSLCSDVVGAAAPVIADVVVTGHGRDEVGLLIFPNLSGCREICDCPHGSLDELATRSEIRTHLRSSLGAFNAANRGSSRSITRAVILREPPSAAANEITDKGYVNQRAVLTKRADVVERLYSGRADLDPDILVFQS